MFLKLTISCLILLLDTSWGACPTNWILWGDHCYLYHDVGYATSGMSWGDARLACQSYGGDLVIIGNNTEFQFLAKTQTPAQRRQHYWIGLTDKAKEGQWKWVDGTDLAAKESHWRTKYGEPNNWGGNEDCAEMHSADGLWNDNACFREFAFICEKHKDAKVPPQPTRAPIDPSLRPVSCEAGWNGFNGSCYMFVKSPETWFEARKDCQIRGGDLTAINTPQEQNFIANRAKLDRQSYWIGLTDKYSEGIFFWVDGTKLNDSISYWNRNEPSNDFGGEDCVELYSWYNTGKWNDNKCTAKRHYVCEKISGKSHCPEDWVGSDNMCYQINAHPEQKKTWLEARAACRSFEGGDLVSIHDVSVKKKLTQEMYKVFTKTGYFWIGLNDIDKEGQFVWSDKSSYVYLNWQLNERKKNSNKTNCVKSELRTSNGFWVLGNCNSTADKNYYICGKKREYNRCHSPLGMENFEITDSQISASSFRSRTTPPSSGRRNAAKGLGLDGAWCAATNDKNQWFRIDLGEYYNVGFIGLQGHASVASYVSSFYIKFSPDGKRWSTYGYQPPTMYTTLPGNSNSDRLTGASTTLSPPIKARFLEIRPLSWTNAICMRVEVYGCPAVADSDSCGKGWVNNTALNTCYKFSMTKLPWAAARANCMLEDGDLLSVTSYDEYRFLLSQIARYRGKVYSFWSGLNDRDYKRVFQWSDGSPVSFVKWSSGYPSGRYYYRKNCAAYRTSYYFYDTYCYTQLPYICKRRLNKKNDVKEKFTGNWISTTDYYWPLDDEHDGEVVGTLPGNATGTFKLITSGVPRTYLDFDGSSNFVKIPGFARTCVSDPSLCANGLTYSFLTYINTTAASQNGRRYLIDILGTDRTSAVGSYVYLENSKLGVYLRSQFYSWHSLVSPPFDNWIHVAFTWNERYGLSIYLNGVKQVTDNSGTRTSSSVKRDRVSDLYLGKSASISTFAKFKMMSLAIWKKYLSADEVKDIYLAELGKCKPGWIPFGQYCYEFNTDALTWTVAKTKCESKGAQLATVSTSIQQAFIGRVIGRDGINRDVYIGLNARRRQSYSTLFFSWVDGSPMLYSNWYPGAPRSSVWRREDVTVMKAGSAAWDDIRYYYSRGYLCQKKKEIFVAGGDSNNAKSIVIRQYSSTTVGCPFETTLNITSALWGKAPTCAYKDVLSKIRRGCASTYFCAVVASSSYLGSHCTTRKELKLNYTCDKPKSTVGDGCSPYWSSHTGNDNCYKLYSLKKTWTQARSFCQKQGADLVSINSRSEELYLTSLLIDSFDLLNIWTGMTDLKIRGSYYWSDGSPVKYTNWFNGQPDDAARRGSCVKTSLHRGYRDMLSLVDDDCASKNAFICKKLKATATTAAPLTTTASSRSCLSGWFNFGGFCYQFSTTNATWIAARDICKRQRAVLASIHSIQENEAVFNFLVNATQNKVDSVWLGLQDKGIFRGQRWTDGTPVNFVRWDTAQPDSNLGQQACTVMSSNGFWRDTNCLVSRNYICKAAVGKATVVPTTKKLTPPTTATTNLKYCPQGWVLSSTTGNCYHFSNSTYTATWFVARTYCQSKGGQLASVESAVEKDFLAPFLLSLRGKEAWIGLSDLRDESGWEWVDRKPVNYINWETGAPDDSFGMEDCVVMKNGGEWNDVYCGDPKPFICERQNKTVPTAKTVAPTAGPDRGFCDPGWSHYLGKCYQFNGNDKLSWFGARNACRDQMTDGKPGDLVAIHSNYEMAFVFSQVPGVQTRMWIGLNDLQQERKFRWSDQSRVTYTYWNTRQPDNYRSNEDCVEILPYYNQKGKWNDNTCSGKQGYICQKDASANKPVATTTDKPSIICPKGYFLYAQNCYGFKKELKTWDEARAACKKDHAVGELASVHDVYDAAFLFSRSFEFTTRIWIGLHRPANQTKFRWSNNNPYDFTNWYAYPRRRYTNLRSCVYVHYSKLNNGYWRDSNCTAKLPYVCKVNKGGDVVKPEHPGNCPTGWVKYDKHCYYIKNSYYGTKKWANAKQACLDYGANLVSIHSAAEQLFLYKKLAKGAKNAWIGLNDRQTEKHMVWSDGTPNDYQNWDYREPNDNQGYENCAEMIYTHGKWNDVSCSSYKGYICKKELGCDEEFGVKNKSIIRDSQMTASSSLSNYFAPSARLGMRSAWCAGTLDNKQYIQIDLTVKKRLTRILLQGFGSDYVLSFYLLYSDDGNTWKTYTVEGTKRILPGNRNTYSTDGVTLTAPISARFIRINPLTWKNKICMRLELLGCSYVCNTPLGMESRTIQNSDITASSEVNTQNAYDARLRNPRGQAWCAKTQDAMQWLQIKLSKEPVKISEVETQGAMIDGKNNVVTAYKIAFSDDGKVWSDYKTYQGEIRIFGGNSAADSAVSHALSIPVTGRYIRFYPLSWSGRICMRIEVFGCAYNCDGSIGVEKGVVINKAITASSSMEKHAPSQARLNVGAFNVGSWCASSIDQQQFLEFDLGADTRITGIATQGFEGDVSKYVTDYRIQFSQDAKFWSSYEVGGVIQLFTGNADGRTVAKNRLSVPFNSRYVRINPRHWKQGICMRVEFYGCALAPIVYPTDAPTPKKKVFKGSMRFTEVAYNESFSDKNSDAFIRMANRIETAITKVYIENYSFKEGFESVQVSELKRGSVIASFIIIYLNADANATSPLKLAVAKGKLGEFTVDKASLEITDISGNSDKPTPAKSKTSPIVTKEGLSSGGKVALIVIFLLLLVAIVAFGLIYYFKRRRGMAQFEPKSFENVVYDGHNVHNIGNEN